MIDKDTIDNIRTVNEEAKKDPRNRALMVIETLCGEDFIYTDIEKLRSDIYRIAHSGIVPRTCNHDSWVEETEKLFERFAKEGML
jgi:hypothetical protein